jgi:hypothetical protein
VSGLGVVLAMHDEFDAVRHRRLNFHSVAGHYASRRFWQCYHSLPEAMRQLADKE